MQEIGFTNAYARGVSSFSNAMTELRVSVMRQLVVSILVCGLLAGWSIRAELSPAARALSANYARASIVAATRSLRGDSVNGAGAWRPGPHGEDVARMSSLFGGRPCSFILWQWLLRTLVSALLVTPVLVAAMVLVGRQAVSDRHRRGAKVRDTTTWTHAHRGALELAGVMAAGGIVVGLFASVYVATPTGLMAVPHIGVAWLAVHCESVAALLSPGWTGAVIWTPAPVAHLLPPSASYAAAVGELGRGGLVGLGIAWCLGASIGAYGSGFVYTRRSSRVRKAVDPEMLTFAGVPIPRKREVYHFMICGATGSGKSVANTQILAKVRERGQRAIVFDTSGEYVARFYRDGRDVLLSSSDVRAAAWTPWADMRRSGDALSMGEALFPRGDGKNEFWSLAGSSVFAGLLEQLRTWGAERNTHLAYLVERLRAKQLMEVLKGTVGERFVDPAAQETATSVLMTAAAQLRSFRFLRDPKAGEKPFSIRTFVETQAVDQWLFVVMRDEDAAVMKPLVSLWLDIAISAVLSLPEEDEGLAEEKRRRLFVSLDELQALQRLPALDGALLRGRKKGLCVTLGIQSIKGVRAIYGNNEADALLGQPQTQLVLRTPEEGTARWLEGQLGAQELERTGQSEQVGADSMQQGGVNLQRTVTQEAAVLAAEIQDLPDLEGFLKTVGSPVMRVRCVPGGPKPQRPGFVQAAEIGEPVAPAVLLAMDQLGSAAGLFVEGDVQRAREAVTRAEELAGGHGAEVQKRIRELRGSLEQGPGSLRL